MCKTGIINEISKAWQPYKKKKKTNLIKYDHYEITCKVN